MSAPSRSARIALVGNPNAGKTTLFNELTGQNQKVGNYSGSTISRKSGSFYTPHGHQIELIDLPGTYSLYPNSPDEQITRDVLLGDHQNEEAPEMVLCVLDATHLERHLYLLVQIIDLGFPVVAALNKIDLAEARGLRIDPTVLSEQFGIPFVPISATTSRGLTTLKHSLRHPFPPPAGRAWKGTSEIESAIAQSTESATTHQHGILKVGEPGSEHEQSIQKTRFAFIHRAISNGLKHPDQSSRRLSEHLDSHLLHPLRGWIFFVLLMLTVFWSIFEFAALPMDFIEVQFENLGAMVERWIPEGDFRSLVVDGIIAGVGGVLIFLPQIMLLFFFISILESSGYMARAAFLMDGIMSKVGLSGKAFLPLLSGYACAIPGILATRTIPNAKERLATILILPWTSCSARLPVYILMIPMMIPGAFAQGLALLGIYVLGTVTALLAAKILKPRLGVAEPPQFLLELPPYQRPQIKEVIRQVWDRASAFIRKAGTVILGLSVLLWFLGTYPKSTSDDPSVQQKATFNAQLGRAIEPIVSPLGWDDKMGTAVIASFAAREVFRSSLAVSYATDEEDGKAMRETLSQAKRDDGSKLYTPLVGLSIIVFFIYALQCLPTTVVVRRETGSWKWALGQLSAMTLFAYLAALLVYQIGKLILAI